MTREVNSIFQQALNHLRHDFSHPDVKDHLNRVQVSVYGTSRQSKVNSDEYRAKSRVPAYYNPNNHTVYLNHAVLPKLGAQVIFNVCYHELLHSVSYHNSFVDGGATIYQSGLKLEIYQTGTYRCLNRGINEGLVQYLTNTNTNANEPAYQNEASLVEEAASVIGIDSWYNALFKGCVEELQNQFEAFFGAGSFSRFSQMIDAKRFDAARQVLTTPALMPQFAEAMAS